MKTTTSVKIDKVTKEKASKLAEQMGLSLSTIINASLKNFVIERHISFSVPSKLNAISKKELRNALKEIKDKKELVGPFSDVSALKKSLASAS